MKQKVTIQDIADAVGCSKTTISRYLNDQTNMMSSETAGRIKGVIELLDYKPSDLARSLKTKKSYTVGIVISDISSPFASSVVTGSGEVLEESGYVPLFINCHEDPSKEKKAISSLVSKGVDGLIVNTTSPDNDFIYDYVKKGIPIVLCDRKIRRYNIDIVAENNIQIITTLVHHLKEQGYNKLALMTAKNVQSSAKDIRKNSFLDAVKEEFGYNAEADIYTLSQNDVKDAQLAIQKFMNSIKENDVPAMIGASTLTTMMLYRGVKNLGYHMPEQVGLCGTNAWSWLESVTWMDMLRPTVTCVNLHGYELGKKAGERILEKIENPHDEIKEINVDIDFIAEESTNRKK